MDRRTMLTTATATLATLATPATGAALHPDAGLLEAIALWKQGQAELKASERELLHLEQEAQDRQPDKPACLFEALAMPDGATLPQSPDGWSRETLCRYAHEGMSLAVTKSGLPHGERLDFLNIPLAPATVARAGEILFDLDRHEDAVDALWKDATAAQDRFDALVSAQWEKALAIAAMPARTASGLLAKCELLKAAGVFAALNNEPAKATLALIADITELAGQAVQS